MKGYLVILIALSMVGCKRRQAILDNPSFCRIQNHKDLCKEVSNDKYEQLGDESLNLRFEYKSSVEGYRIKGKLLALRGLGAAMEGPCSLHFYNHSLGYSYRIFSEDYIDSFQPAIEGRDSLGEWIFNPHNIPNKNEYLQFRYHAMSPKEDGSPFFFEDVDFDGQKEILVFRTSPKRRYVHYYEVFKLIGKDSCVQLTYQPFIGFDSDHRGTDIVDHKNNTITRYWGDDTVLIFHFDRTENSLQFNYPCSIDTIIRVK